MSIYPPNKIKKQMFFEELWKDIDKHDVVIHKWISDVQDTVTFVRSGGDQLPYWTFLTTDENLFRNVQGKGGSKGKKLYPYAVEKIKKELIKRELRGDLKVVGSLRIREE